MRKNEIGFIDFFKEIPDHRIDRKKLHSVEITKSIKDMDVLKRASVL